MSNAPRVTVVVPNFNGADHLRRCLAALDRQDYADFEVVVIDNASTDESAEVVRDHGPRTRLVQLPANRGYAGACNVGAASAAGPYVAFLNNDTEPDLAWLRELVACAERHPQAASIASKVVRLSDPELLDGAGDSMTRSLKAFRRGAGERDMGRYSEEEQVFSASGTACLWRRDLLFDLGAFDNWYFAYYEDVDLGFRARLAGFECWYAPGAVVGHAGAATAATVRAVDSRYSIRNRWATTIKNAPPAWLFANAHLIVVGELLLWGRVLLNGDARQVAVALAELGRSLPMLLRKRSAVQKSRRVGYRELARLVERSLPPPRPIR